MGSLASFRQHILGVVLAGPLFTEAEKLLCNHNVHECTDAAQLARWARNVQREAARRGVFNIH